MGLRQMEPAVEEISGRKFYIRPFPALKAANITGELASVLAPLAGMLAPLASQDGDLMDVDVGKAAEALSGCTAIDGDRLESLMKKLLIGNHVVVEIEKEDGRIDAAKMEADLLNEIFCGAVQDMFVLCFYVIRLNFNGFFKKLPGLSGKAGTAGAAVRKIF